MSKMSLSVDPRRQKAAADVATTSYGAGSLVLPDPATATVAAMHDGCRVLEAWMTETDNVAALDEARHWLDAVETYLSHKNAEGPAQTTARLLEARIGEVAPRRSSSAIEKSTLSQFRLMAENRPVWEDKLPLPRRRVLRLIRDDLADERPIPETPATLESDIRLGDLRVRQLWPSEEFEYTRYAPDSWRERLFGLRECHPLRRLTLVPKVSNHVHGYQRVDDTDAWRCVQDYYAVGEAPETGCGQTWVRFGNQDVSA